MPLLQRKLNKSKNILHAPSGLHSSTGETDMIGKIREHGKTKNLIARQNTSHPSQQQQNRRLTSNFHSIVTTIPISDYSERTHSSSIGQVTGERRDIIDHEKFRCGRRRCPNKATKRETIRGVLRVLFWEGLYTKVYVALRGLPLMTFALIRVRGVA